MAGNKRRQGLDQPAGDTLSAIDDSLAWLVESAKQNCLKPDEFTAKMAMQKMQEAGITKTAKAMQCMLDRMFEAGELTRRKILLNGKVTCVYARLIKGGA